MAVDVVLGLQRGDEGKGRIVDIMAPNYDIVARFNGGPNAGHTIAREGKPTLWLHQVPSGIAYPKILNIMGNGMYIDPLRLLAEIAELAKAGLTVTPKNLVLSAQAHLILPHHISLDEVREAGSGGQGSTKRGIAYVGADKYEREGKRAELLICDPEALRHAIITGLKHTNGLRKDVGLPMHTDPQAEADEWLEQALTLKPFITDTVSLLQTRLTQGARVLAEGAQAFQLDIEHGMYPAVTSSHTTIGSVLNGLGINHQQVGKVTGVAKLVRSHVGGGPLVTRIEDEALAARIRGEQGKVDSEFGASTGRPRAIGNLDLVELKKAVLLNGVDDLVLTKLDAVPKYGDQAKIATAYTKDNKTLALPPASEQELVQCVPVYAELTTWSEDISEQREYNQLPQAAQAFVAFIEKELAAHVTALGVGPNREQLIVRSVS
jgi:adenylosuccinate synthase